MQRTRRQASILFKAVFVYKHQFSNLEQTGPWSFTTLTLLFFGEGAGGRMAEIRSENYKSPKWSSFSFKMSKFDSFLASIICLYFKQATIRAASTIVIYLCEESAIIPVIAINGSVTSGVCSGLSFPSPSMNRKADLAKAGSILSGTWIMRKCHQIGRSTSASETVTDVLRFFEQHLVFAWLALLFLITCQRIRFWEEKTSYTHSRFQWRYFPRKKARKSQQTKTVFRHFYQN